VWCRERSDLVGLFCGLDSKGHWIEANFRARRGDGILRGVAVCEMARVGFRWRAVMILCIGNAAFFFLLFIILLLDMIINETGQRHAIELILHPYSQSL
jgi:hypothetical protein